MITDAVYIKVCSVASMFPPNGDVKILTPQVNKVHFIPLIPTCNHFYLKKSEIIKTTLNTL